MWTCDSSPAIGTGVYCHTWNESKLNREGISPCCDNKSIVFLQSRRWTVQVVSFYNKNLAKRVYTYVIRRESGMGKGNVGKPTHFRHECGKALCLWCFPHVFANLVTVNPSRISRVDAINLMLSCRMICRSYELSIIRRTKWYKVVSDKITLISRWCILEMSCI